MKCYVRPSNASRITLTWQVDTSRFVQEMSNLTLHSRFCQGQNLKNFGPYPDELKAFPSKQSTQQSQVHSYMGGTIRRFLTTLWLMYCSTWSHAIVGFIFKKVNPLHGPGRCHVRGCVHWSRRTSQAPEGPNITVTRDLGRSLAATGQLRWITSPCCKTPAWWRRSPPLACFLQDLSCRQLAATQVGPTMSWPQ